MNKLAIIIGLLLTSSMSFAETCEYSYEPTNTKISFEAFKTLKKLGVKVGFDKFSIATKEKVSKELIDQVKDAQFKIDSFSINSGNPARDESLKLNFFTKNKSPLAIEGKVIEVKNDFLMTEINIGGTKKIIPLKYTLKDTTLEASATIDLFDFSLSKNLSSINKACKDLHEGKTWSDVNIRIESNFTKSCH